MGTIADKLNLLLNTKAAIKSAIIGKGQTVADSDPFSAYPAKIQAIETGIQLPTLTNPGTAADLLAGKELIDQDGNPLTGTMPSLTAQTITPGVSDQVIAAGRYLAGAVTVSGDSNLVASNIKSGVSVFGVSGSYGGEITLNASGAQIVNGSIKVIVQGLLSSHTIKNLALRLLFEDGYGDRGRLYSIFNVDTKEFYAESGFFGSELIYPSNGYFLIIAPNSRQFTNVTFEGAIITVS